MLNTKPLFVVTKNEKTKEVEKNWLKIHHGGNAKTKKAGLTMFTTNPVPRQVILRETKMPFYNPQ